MFDMKPDAPDGIRSPHKWIDTNLPGVITNEHMPAVAKIMNKVTLVRSVHHTMKNHNSAGYYALRQRRTSMTSACATRRRCTQPTARWSITSHRRRATCQPSSRTRTSCATAPPPGSTRQLPRQSPRPVPVHERSQLKELCPAGVEPADKHRSKATGLAPPTAAACRPAVATTRLLRECTRPRCLLRASAWHVELAKDAQRFRPHTGAG